MATPPRGRTIAVLPVKRFGAAKQRLDNDLSDGTRRALAEAMVTDVLIALRRARRVDEVLVVSGETLAVALAAGYDAAAVVERRRELGRESSRAVLRALGRSLLTFALTIVVVGSLWVGAIEGFGISDYVAKGPLDVWAYLATDEDAAKAITDFHEYQMEGRALVVNEARPKPEGGFGGGGAGRGRCGFGGGGGGRGMDDGDFSGGRRKEPRW